MRQLQFVLLATGLCLVACGGKAVMDGSSGGGGEAGSTTTTSSGNGGASACPEPFPGLGAACTTDGATCPLELSCCGAHALCQSGIWTFGGPDCAEDCPTSCGPSGLGCVAGALCVATGTEGGSSQRCVANPCPGEATCLCAGSLCQPSGLTCLTVTGNVVLCNCPNC